MNLSSSANVPNGHRVSRRAAEHLHPRAPIFRVTHPRHGLLDVAARDHVDGSTRLTVSSANPVSSRLGQHKRQTFQHEHLSDHLFEGRFDGAAHAAGGYQQLEDSVRCYAVDDWQPGQVLSAQMYLQHEPGDLWVRVARHL